LHGNLPVSDLCPERNRETTRLYLPFFLGFVNRTISETRFRVKKPRGADAETFIRKTARPNDGRFCVYQRQPTRGAERRLKDRPTAAGNFLDHGISAIQKAACDELT
jgi:hypothetical protein